MPQITEVGMTQLELINLTIQGQIVGFGRDCLGRLLITNVPEGKGFNIENAVKSLADALRITQYELREVNTKPVYHLFSKDISENDLYNLIDGIRGKEIYEERII